MTLALPTLGPSCIHRTRGRVSVAETRREIQVGAVVNLQLRWRVTNPLSPNNPREYIVGTRLTYPCDIPDQRDWQALNGGSIKTRRPRRIVKPVLVSRPSYQYFMVTCFEDSVCDLGWTKGWTRRQRRSRCPSARLRTAPSGKWSTRWEHQGPALSSTVNEEQNKLREHDVTGQLKSQSLGCNPRPHGFSEMRQANSEDEGCRERSQSNVEGRGGDNCNDVIQRHGAPRYISLGSGMLSSTRSSGNSLIWAAVCRCGELYIVHPLLHPPHLLSTSSKCRNTPLGRLCHGHPS